MPPKRKPNNTKKRRAKPDQGTATTPSPSPSKLNSADHSTQSTPNQLNRSTPPTPSSKPASNGPSQADHKQPADSDPPNRPSKQASTAAGSAQKNSSDHQPAKANELPSSVKSAASNSDFAPLTERSVNRPESNSNQHHSNTSNETGRPNKSTKDQNSKQTPGAHRVPGSVELDVENHPDPTAKSKAESKKSQQASNKPSTTNSHSDDPPPANQHQNPEDDRTPEKVASEPTYPQNGIPKESSEHHKEPDTAPQQQHPEDDPAPAKIASKPTHPQNGRPKDSSESKSSDHKEPETLSANSENGLSKSLPNSHKKPTKHVKFTNAAAADPSADAPRPEAGEHQNHRKQSRPEETEEHGDVHPKHKSIRREMSGAADQFDFDAQQRLYDGPGGGMVKKPRHRRPNGTSSHSADQRAADGPDEAGSDQSSTASHDEDARHPHRDSMGFQHAQRCLQSIVDIQHLNARPADLDPDLLQIYLSYFDQDQDGLLDPLDTWRAFRRLGFGLLWAAAATLALHALFSPFIGMGSWLLPDVLGRCQLPLGPHLSKSSPSSINIDPHDISHVDKDHTPDKVGPAALWKKTQEHMGVAEMTDPIGWLKFVLGWLIALSLTWPTDLCVKHELINGVYNGELLFLVAHDLST
ncbi:hypothetical protein PtB15_14B203 [Puccinia triticina]|nr:hypothetical protein PtB15_14B203 [Puccinia triticina]